MGKLWRQHTCLSNTAVHFSVLWVVLVVHFHRTLTQVNLTAACNVDCHCMSDMFEPVCGADNLIYFSPCYAGCHNTSADRKVLDSSQTLLFFPVISQFSFVFFQYLQIQCNTGCFHYDTCCCNHVKLEDADYWKFSAVEKNTGVFSLIQMHELPSARACGQ